MLKLLHFSNLIDPVLRKYEGTVPDSESNILNKYIKYDDLVNLYESPNYATIDGLGIDLEDRNIRIDFWRETGYCGGLSDENCIIDQPLLNFEIYGDETNHIALTFYGKNCKKLKLIYTSNDELIQENIFEVEDDFINLDILSFNNTFTSTQCTISAIETYEPYQMIKISSVVEGVIKEINKILSSSLLEEINVLSDDLPINSFDCEISVIGKIEIKENDPINVYSNNNYYGTFFVNEYELVSVEKIYNTHRYSLNCYNSLKLLQEYEYKGYSIGRPNVYIEEDLSNATGVQIRQNSQISVNDITLGNLPIYDGRTALCKLAYARNNIILSARHGLTVYLSELPSTITHTILRNRILGNTTFNRIKEKSSATYNYISLETTERKSVTFDNSKGDIIIYRFENPSDIYDSSNENIAILTKSSNYVEFRALTDNVTITFSEYSLKKNVIVDENINALKPNEITLPDLEIYYPSLMNNKRDSVNKYLKSRGTIRSKIILDGEQVGDLIEIETAFEGIMTGIITSMNISFGYRDVADIEVLEWSL